MKKLYDFFSTFAITVCSIAMVLLFSACGKDAIDDDIQPAVTGSVEEDPHVLTSGTNMWKMDMRDYGVDLEEYIGMMVYCRLKYMPLKDCIFFKMETKFILHTVTGTCTIWIASG